MVILSMGIGGDRWRTLLYYMISERCQGNGEMFKRREIKRFVITEERNKKGGP
jgi:hypothetical protein